MVTPYYHTLALTNQQVLRGTQISETRTYPPGHRRRKGIARACFPPEELKIRTRLLCGEQKAEVLTPALIHTQNAVPQRSPVSWSAPSSPELPSSTPASRPPPRPSSPARLLAPSPSSLPARLCPTSFFSALASYEP